MAIQVTDERLLRATLCEVERGLFCIAYSWDAAGGDRRLLPRYQVGTNAADAMRRVEREARGHGYAAIVWEEMNPAD